MKNFPDVPIDDQFLAAHSRRVRKGLRAHESDTSVRKKYEWIATYHNYVCQTFADKYPVRGNEGAYPEEMAIGAWAQRALDHIVPFEALYAEQPPRPFDAQRLRQRVNTN